MSTPKKDAQTTLNEFMPIVAAWLDSVRPSRDKLNFNHLRESASSARRMLDALSQLGQQLEAERPALRRGLSLADDFEISDHDWCLIAPTVRSMLLFRSIFSLAGDMAAMEGIIGIIDRLAGNDDGASTAESSSPDSPPSTPPELHLRPESGA